MKQGTHITQKELTVITIIIENDKVKWDLIAQDADVITEIEVLKKVIKDIENAAEQFKPEK